MKAARGWYVQLNVRVCKKWYHTFLLLTSWGLASEMSRDRKRINREFIRKEIMLDKQFKIICQLLYSQAKLIQNSCQ